ncbi:MULTISPECIES: WXG100 family type VII secretion target [unclassified Saccharothrix]|uniref:WXG100 family type VII secretion target n=1 Tax=unclassified Saccharothrix TaxID=2593673 RepID=UPI00307DE8AA
MTGLSGYEIYLMVSQGEGPEVLNQAADVALAAGTRIQSVGDNVRGVTPTMQGAWQGPAAERAVQAVQPIEQGLRGAQDTVDKIEAVLRAQAQNYAQLRPRVLPMLTPEPPELTLYDQLTPWDTDNEIARREWFEADANNRRVYAEYAAMTSQNQAMLPQAAASGGAQGANTAVQAAGGTGARSATSAPPEVGGGGGGGSTAPSSAGGGQASAPPQVGAGGGAGAGGGKTAASNAGGEDGGLAGRPPAVPGSGAPRQPADRTTVADSTGMAGGVPGGVPLTTTPRSGRDTERPSGVPKGDHLSGAGAAPVLPGGVAIGDPTGTRGQRGSLGSADRTGVLGRVPVNAPTGVGAGAGAAAGRAGMAGMGGFAPHAPHARDDDDREYKRTVHLDEDTDALVGRMPTTTVPVIGED